MLRYYLILLAIGLACSTSRPALGLCNYYNFYLDPGQVVPASSAMGSGVAELFVCEDRRLTGTITVYLEEDATSVHLHGPAGPGQLGPVIYDLPLRSGSIISVDVGPVPGETEKLFITDSAYVDVHTVEHPEGAIRGLVHPEGLRAIPATWGSVKALHR